MKNKIIDDILDDKTLQFDCLHKKHKVFGVNLCGEDYFVLIHTHITDFVDWYRESGYLNRINHEWDYSNETPIITEDYIDFDYTDVCGEGVIEYIRDNKEKLFEIELNID